MKEIRGKISTKNKPFWIALLFLFTYLAPMYISSQSMHFLLTASGFLSLYTMSQFDVFAGKRKLIPVSESQIRMRVRTQQKLNEQEVFGGGLSMKTMIKLQLKELKTQKKRRKNNWNEERWTLAKAKWGNGFRKRRRIGIEQRKKAKVE